MLQELVAADKEAAKALVNIKSPGFLIALDGLKPSSKTRVWVDNLTAPRCSLILSPTGWHVCLGAFLESDAAHAAQLILGPDGLIPIEAYGISISRTVILCTGIDLKLHAPVEVTESNLIVFHREEQSPVASASDPRIRDLGYAEFSGAAEFAPMLHQFWPDPAEPIEQHFGKAWVEDGIVLGICYSCFYADRDHEPHIVVRREHRGRGIGSMLTRAYARDLLSRGLHVYWTHTEGNTASARCANAIGMVPYGHFKLQQHITRTTGDNR